MAKVVKYCAACEEGFAEKFTFCPDCGGALAAYELNPVAGKANVGSTNNTEAKTFAPAVEEKPMFVEQTAEPTPAETFLADEDDELLELDQPTESFPAEAVAPETISSFNQDFDSNEYRSNGNGSSGVYQESTVAAAGNHTNYDDGTYHITFVEEKNGSGRNLLLLGSFLLVTSIAFGGLVYSLFNSNAIVGSLGSDDTLLALINNDVPPIEEIEPPKKNKDDGGGGGGGGKENPEPATKGRLPTQVENPIMPPQPLPKVSNASLPNPQQTQGKITRETTDEPVGIPTGALSDRLSSGSGSGGGIGSGNGTGVGSGRGTGEGSGIGSGSGSGIGNGNGSGTGDGDSNGGPPPMKPKGPTKTIAILSKPRPSYTDAARQNQVTGVVRLRVTFLASGQIGSVTPVSGLSYGLTEQAIAAAKQIKFQPALENGVPKTVTKQIEYSFSIY